ncbi:DUF7657 domain-containing protein [Spirosoma rigui]|uniref:DUF7657 domain-containing protein n=1 Tax=Spirosoma rigui TaxID=564064 RepID=UPI001FE25DEA|nr:hypothetical protein [Spirosoma rigui]
MATSASRIAEDDTTRPFELIRFDKRVKWFIGICIGLFIILTLAKINYSSIGMWNTVLPDGSDAKRGVVSGTPKSIRIDEWAIVTPFMLSQAHQGFPLENTAIGGERVSLLGYYPVKHFVTVFRPDYWGFHILDIERAFAWHWNFVIFFNLIAVTLVFLLLTRNQFWLSLLGACWLIFSPGFAWWSFFLLTSIFGGCVLLLSSAYVFYARSTRTILIASLAFTWSLATFALIIYPPYQVPLGYLLMFLLAGFVWRDFNKVALFDKIGLKLGSFAVAFALLGLIFYFFYVDAKSTIDVMSNTAYPGKRSELGGTGFVANWFSEYYSGWLVTNEKFPQGWLNICELSHFITFTPIIALCLGVYFMRLRKVDPLLMILLVYVLFQLVWIEVGFPAWLAKATLFDVSPTRRTQIPFGIANVILTVLYLNYIRIHSVKLSSGLSALLIAAVVGVMVFAAWLNLTDANGFYKVHQLVLPTAFFLALNYLLLPVASLRHKELIVAGSLVLFTLPNLKVNPVSKGLSPITDNALYKKVLEVHEQDPKARWLVLGSQYITYLVTATGVNQLSGVKSVPDFTTMKVLDPGMKRQVAYNRYAHSVYNSYIDPAHPDSVLIQNTFEDGYQVGLDPCSPKLQSLNVRYFVFDHQPQPVEIRCLTPVATLGGLSIYKRQ